MKKLLIVGGAESLIHCPFEDINNEIWAIGYQVDGKNIPRADRCFEMHNNPPEGAFKYGENRAVEYVVNGQIEYPSDVLLYEFPLNDVCKFFKLDLNENKFFRSTIDYMLSLAIYEGYKDIEIHRCTMIAKEEYYYHRQSINYLVGYGRAIGVKISFTKDSEAFYSPWLYGYENPIDYQKMQGRLYFMVKKRLEAFEIYKKNYGAYQQLLGYIGSNKDRLSVEQITELENKMNISKQVADHAEFDVNYFEGAIQSHEQMTEFLR